MQCETGFCQLQMSASIFDSLTHPFFLSFFRKRCIHSKQRFDFLKDIVSDVADLQGDLDEPASTSFLSSSSAPTSSTFKPTVSAGKMEAGAVVPVKNHQKSSGSTKR